GKGTGLGLSQVYGFAQQSGGGVSVASTVGTGTTITIHLPRSHGAPAVAAPTEARPVTRQEGTILVVEDNAEVASVTSTLLEQLGYRGVCAGSAPPGAGPRADRSGVQRHRHAGHERDGARRGDHRPVSAHPGAADQRLQRRGAGRRGAVRRSAQTLRGAGAGKGRSRSPGK